VQLRFGVTDIRAHAGIALVVDVRVDVGLAADRQEPVRHRPLRLDDRCSSASA
jgi:hypothetical protein